MYEVLVNGYLENSIQAVMVLGGCGRIFFSPPGRGPALIELQKPINLDWNFERYHPLGSSMSCREEFCYEIV